MGLPRLCTAQRAGRRHPDALGWQFHVAEFVVGTDHRCLCGAGRQLPRRHADVRRTGRIAPGDYPVRRRYRATAVLGKVGQVITRGAQLAVIERNEGPHDPLVAVVYVPQDKAGLIHRDDKVDLSVQSAPAEQFGVLRGRVLSVAEFPASTQQISEFLGDAQLGQRFSTQGEPLKVVVQLTADHTTSGFAWSTGQGPPYQIDSRTLVTAAFHLAPLKPIHWVVS